MEISNPYTIINETGSSDWLLISEHAGKQVPEYLNNLGLPIHLFDEHIGHDIGAYEMTLALSEKLDATAIVCNYSRLVIDCNRPLTDSSCMPAISDGIVIPANTALSTDDRLARINGIYQPFHGVVFQVLADKLARNPKTKIANIHSFTPMLAEEGKKRPWDIGFIYRNPKPSVKIMENLRRQTNHCIGDNQPYDGFIHKGYTIPAHCESQEMQGFLVEFRQNLINTPIGIEYWSDTLINAITDIE